MVIDAGGLAQDVNALLSVHASERLGHYNSACLCSRVVSATIAHAEAHGDMAHQLMGGLARLYKEVLAELGPGQLTMDETAYLHDLICAAGRHYLRAAVRSSLSTRRA